jgi:drug/metabolite transporter (DMT)-like permease
MKRWIPAAGTMKKPSPAGPALAVVASALVWGLAWWPLRRLEALAWHPLQSSVFLFGLGAIAIALLRPDTPRVFATTRGMWLLAAVSGLTNAAFNWAIVIGDVVRVILLFYLMPLWSVLLAWLLLGERITLGGALRIAVAMAGVALVLQTDSGMALPLPASLADWLALGAGFTFALSNVLLRRYGDVEGAAKALSMFTGSALVSLALLLAIAPAPWLPALSVPALALGAALSAILVLGNFSLQYGAARLPARVCAVVLLSEVVFATVSSVAMGTGTLTPGSLLGAGMILLAGVLATGEG